MAANHTNDRYSSGYRTAGRDRRSSGIRCAPQLQLTAFHYPLKAFFSTFSGFLSVSIGIPAGKIALMRRRRAIIRFQASPSMPPAQRVQGRSAPEIRAAIEAFLANRRQPALLEPGEELLALEADNFSLEFRARASRSRGGFSTSSKHRLPA